ncbi:IS3 family transposase, partial [Streptomyces sp. NPDC051162]|uniref:IS3 family transposase n=1 Tax=Streptomyces sp. NPDC051162 TaxID=3154747 RepID=UPI0034242EE8
ASTAPRADPTPLGEVTENAPEAVVAFIGNQRAGHGVPHRVSCRVVGVSEAWFHKWRRRPDEPTKREVRRARLEERIIHFFTASGGTYGSPRITQDLWAENWQVSVNTVAEIMAELGPQGRKPPRRRSLTRQGKRKAAPDLVHRRFDAVEILPRHSTRGGWVTDVLDGGTNNPCARAHVPLADKQAADAQLAEGFANQRVVEDDQFKVEISGSIAEPQAVCRQSTPAGSAPSGNGWIKNTTEPVPHVNKTTTPQGPAGTRAAMAQACLGTTLGQGSDAKGDITGWADADLFRQANSTTAGLARCHLIPNILGGKGGTNDGGPDNLFPCWQSGTNTGTPSMRTYEAVAQKAVREVKDGGILGPNDAIFYQVTPDYRSSDSTIPQGVTMSARVERSDGTSQPLFPDVYITNTQKNTGLLNLGN